jgi:hypothetical protein
MASPTINKLLEFFTGKDDLERIASKGDRARLDDYLKTRRLYFPVTPSRFLDAETCSDQAIIDLIREGADLVAGPDISLWVMELDGQNRLPAFSSIKRAKKFSEEMSKGLDKIFPLGCVEMLLEDVIKAVDVDVIDLNRFSKNKWEIRLTK